MKIKPELIRKVNDTLPLFEKSIKKFENEYRFTLYKFYLNIFNERKKFKYVDDYHKSVFKDDMYKSRYYSSPHYQISSYTGYNPALFKTWVTTTVNKAVDFEKEKLYYKVAKYVLAISELAVIEDVTNKYVHFGPKGLEGLWYIHTADDKISMIIESIWAGGYNIQVEHIRTLVKIQSLIKKDKINVTVSDYIQKAKTASDKASKIARDAERKAAKDAKKQMELVKEKIRMLSALKDVMEYYQIDTERMKHGHEETGYQYGSKLNYSELKKFWDKFYTGIPIKSFGIDEHGVYVSEYGKVKNIYKRDQLLQMAKDGELDDLYTWMTANQ